MHPLLDRLARRLWSPRGAPWPTENERQRQITRLLTREVNAIDDLFLKYAVDARIDRQNVTASDTGGFVRYRIRNSAKVSKLTSLEDDLAQLISELRDEDVRVRIRKPRLIIELPYPLERRTLMWEDAPLQRLRPFQALAGMDYSALEVAPVIVDWSGHRTSNMLVSGETGSGKTNGLLEIILSLSYGTSPSEVHFVIIDPKFSPSINALRGLPHVSIYNEPSECALAIEAVKLEVNRRKRRPDKRKLFLVCEELSELMIEAGSDKSTLFEQMKSVAQIGRELGVHLIACTQKAVVEVVDTVLRANLPLRLAFRVGTSDESRVATGLTDVDCVRLPGSGAGYFVRDGRERRIQTHYLDPDGIFDVVDGIAAQWLADTPYRIVTQNAVVEEDDLPATVTQDQVDLILGSMEMGELFADDGTPIRGVKSRIIALVHGADAPRGGANNLWANLILGYIFRTQA
jgi:DNA segregation ATPase FtsK/SpoIIIE, S-DNA-T family